MLQVASRTARRVRCAADEKREMSELVGVRKREIRSFYFMVDAFASVGVGHSDHACLLYARTLIDHLPACLVSSVVGRYSFVLCFDVGEVNLCKKAFCIGGFGRLQASSCIE